MMTLTLRRHLTRGVALALGVALAGCGLDKVDVPDYSGPSTLGLNLLVTATPDVLVADAVSTAIVQATLRGPNGEPVGNRAVFFAVTDENGAFVDLGTLQSSTTPAAFPGVQITEATQSNGIAQVVYRVPERISLTAIQRIYITARLVGTDADGQQYKSARVELRPAEVRRFPENPSNTPPLCGFFVDPEVGPFGGTYPTNFVVRFRSTSSDAQGPIVRYFWDFGDSSQNDQATSPDTSHAWRSPGNYPVTHVVTDTNGVQSACSLIIPVR